MKVGDQGCYSCVEPIVLFVKLSLDAGRNAWMITSYMHVVESHLCGSYGTATTFVGDAAPIWADPPLS